MRRSFRRCAALSGSRNRYFGAARCLRLRSWGCWPPRSRSQCSRSAVVAQVARRSLRSSAPAPSRRSTVERQPTGSVALEASPKAIAYGAGIGVGDEPDQDSVSRIDPATSTVQQTISVGNGPEGIAVGAGSSGSRTPRRHGLADRPAEERRPGGRTIPVGNGPKGVAYGLGGVWVANSVDRTVVRIDPLTGAKGRPIPVDAGADAIAVGDGAVWVTSESAGVLSRVDPRSGSVIPINVGNGPSAVAAGPGAVWVANSADATVWRIDPATKRGEGRRSRSTKDRAGSRSHRTGASGSRASLRARSRRSIRRPARSSRRSWSATSRRVSQSSADATYVAVQGSGAAHRGGTLTLVVPNPSGVYDTGPAEVARPGVRATRPGSF